MTLQSVIETIIIMTLCWFIFVFGEGNIPLFYVACFVTALAILEGEHPYAH